MDKPRIRIPAGSVPVQGAFTKDSFQNLQASLGYGANNLSSFAGYGYTPVSRIRQRLEWMYRQSWLVRKIVDGYAKDMTRAGVTITSGAAPDEIEKIQVEWKRLKVMERMRQGIQWGRLYGGGLCVIMIDKQDVSTPLEYDRIPKGSFKGLITLDRWMVSPSLENLVSEFGPEFGMPVFYEVLAGAGQQAMKIHYTRLLRFEGDDLPYWQRIAEQSWTASVVEAFFDRMLAYDSATTGAAQLVYKAHLRVYSVDGFRDLVAEGDSMMEAFAKNVEIIRQMQTNEGMTVIDIKDKMEMFTNGAFAGLAQALDQFGQQLAGASGMPLVILFGQSPSGFSTGDVDVQNYYDRVNGEQEDDLREPVNRLLRVSYASQTGRPSPADLSFHFNPLWQIPAEKKAEIAKNATDTILAAYKERLLSERTAMKELRALAGHTGFFSNITDEAIENAEEEIPTIEGMGDLPPDVQAKLKAEMASDVVGDDPPAGGTGKAPEGAKNAE